MTLNLSVGTPRWLALPSASWSPLSNIHFLPLTIEFPFLLMLRDEVRSAQTHAQLHRPNTKTALSHKSHDIVYMM
jgi:hypothetical protein